VRQHTERLAAASLLARYWPPVGGRNHIGLALAGALARAGWTESAAVAFIEPIAKFRGDSKADENAATFRRIKAGKSATGQPTCADVFGARVWTRVAEWLHIERGEVREPPRPLARAVGQLEPYPVDALSSLLSKAAKAIRVLVQCPIELAAQSVLATATLSVQGHVNVKLPTNDVRPVSEYFATIAESGERKTSSDDRAKRGVGLREHELWAQYLQDSDDYARLIALFKSERDRILRSRFLSSAQKDAELAALGAEPPAPLIPLLTCPDPTLEGVAKWLRDGWPSVAVFADEGGVFVGGHAMNSDNRLKTAAGFSDLWNGGALKRVRAGDQIGVLYNRRVSLHLQVQPLVAAEFFGDPLLSDQGLLSRILAVQPETASGTRFSQQFSPEDKAEAERELAEFDARILENLRAPLSLTAGTRKELSPRTLPLSSPATSLWWQFADHIEKLIAPGGPAEAIRAFANKTPEHAVRLAAVSELMRDLFVAEISQDAMVAGIKLAEFYLNENLRIRGLSHGDGDLSLAGRLLNWLLTRWEHELVSLPDIYQRGPYGIDDQATARRMVAILQDHGWLVRCVGAMEVNGVRRRTVWHIIRNERGQ